MADRVRVYRNLHNNKLSVQRYTRGVGWRVVGHVENVALVDVSFKVYEAPRQRVLRTKKKTVHAYVIGTIADCFEAWLPLDATRVSYNPYKAGSFVIRETGEPIHTAFAAEVYATGEIFI